MVEGGEEASFEVKLPHFANVSEEKAKELLSNRQSSNTRYQTKCHMKILSEYLKETHRPNIEKITDADVPEMLLSFYTNVQREDGELYKLQTLKCIRASINCYMKETRNLDIIQDHKFIKANEMFCAMTVETK